MKLISPLDGTAAIDVLEKGIDDLMALCDVVASTFTTARETYNSENGHVAK